MANQVETALTELGEWIKTNLEKLTNEWKNQEKNNNYRPQLLLDNIKEFIYQASDRIAAIETQIDGLTDDDDQAKKKWLTELEKKYHDPMMEQIDKLTESARKVERGEIPVAHNQSQTATSNPVLKEAPKQKDTSDENQKTEPSRLGRLIKTVTENSKKTTRKMGEETRKAYQSVRSFGFFSGGHQTSNQQMDVEKNKEPDKTQSSIKNKT